jgi:serine/threonine-protein kinase
MSDTSGGGQTLLHPEELKRAPSSSVGPHSHGLPADLVKKATSRLQAIALLYAGVFFMAAFFPPLLFGADRREVFGHVINWLPGAFAITAAIVVAAILRLPNLSLNARMAICVVFEIVSSYGIAASEFLQPLNLEGPWIGLSWVAVWMLLFTIVIPSTPGRSVMAGLAAISAVPVMVAVSIAVFPPLELPSNFFLGFFFIFIFPYLLVVGMAYVGARVMSALGNEVRKARELGSYQLIERLGQGGMGEVWSARHRLLARPAAIKLIRPSASSAGISEDARRRFEREAQAIASLRSPHTVNLFDFGVSDDGTFYYVMELLEGLDAERLVKKYGPLPAERVIHVIRQVCHSLSEAESIGLVHRDIKPANIILCRYGEDNDFVKVLDFGIVKAIQEPGRAASEPTQSALTMEHIVHGTPAFIAPEQALGASAVDNRADIYATGCLAYWLLTGQLVFSGDTPMQLVMHHAQTPPSPPSSRTELPIPPELDALVLACLEKNPADRPQTARELARRLDAIPIRNRWTEERAKDWWQSHQPH